MSGKRVVLAEQENLDAIINDYFDDDLQTFVNTFKGDVLQMEYKINKCLTVSAHVAHHMQRDACLPTRYCLSPD